MQRKTNLFYNSGKDSSFITFSNFGESLSSVLLDPNAKLFPTRFLCVYMEDLKSDADRKAFIKDLINDYENRLAFLRDYYVSSDDYPEHNILPLNYLLETINEKNGVITYIGSISEQDYNGSYTDMICTIDNDTYSDISLVTDTDNQVSVEYDEYSLHGWSEEELPSYYQDTFYFNGASDEPQYLQVSDLSIENDSLSLGQTATVSFQVNILAVSAGSQVTVDIDNENAYTYNSTSYIQGIKYVKTSVPKDIQFNMLIPLYDIYNSLHSTDYDNVVSGIFDDENGLINLQNPSSGDYWLYNYMIPYGIWFSGNDPVVLKTYQMNSQYIRPSWSVVLSAQFKPFPYSQTVDPTDKMPDISSIGAYATFAEIMKNQKDILSKFDTFTSQFAAINNRINSLQHLIDGTTSLGLSADDITSQLSSLNKQVTNINSFLESNFGEGGDWITYKLNS